jgi:DNA-binding transcriptional LysR family regulator
MLQITPVGEHLLHYAEKILSDMAAARESLDQRAQWGISRLRLGSSRSFGSCLLPEILQSFRRDFPEWPVSVKSGDTRECVEWLDQNAIDLAIGIAPNRAEAVEVTSLFTDEVMWIVPPDHAWARAGTAVPEEIPAQNFICNNASSYTSRLLEKHLERDGIRLKCSMELGSLTTVKEMVKAGVGISALAEWTVRKELEEKQLVAVPLGKRKLKRNWCLLRSLQRTPGLAQEKFAKLSLDATRALTFTASTLLAKLFWLSSCMDFDIFDVVV